MKPKESNIKKKYPDLSINPIINLPALIQAVKIEKDKLTYNNKVLNKPSKKHHYIMKDKDGSYIM